VRGIIWAGIIFFIEYLSGWVLKLTIGVCPWDYSTFSRYTIDGFIRLDYLPIWFVAGLLFEKISGCLNHIHITWISSNNLKHDQPTVMVIMQDGKDFLESNLAASWAAIKKKPYPEAHFSVNSKPFSSRSTNLDKR
jgi:uncharacterized membrane protein